MRPVGTYSTPKCPVLAYLEGSADLGAAGFAVPEDPEGLGDVGLGAAEPEEVGAATLDWVL